MKKALALMALVCVASLSLVSCSGKGSNSQPSTSGLTFRVFVSNPLLPSSTTVVPVLQIVDASLDKLSRFRVSLLGASAFPAMMAVSPDKNFTLVYSSTGNTLVTVNNKTESAVAGSSVSIPTISLPGPTESMFISRIGSKAYVAVPSASVAGQPQGAVEQVDLTTGTITATIPVPSVRFVVPSASQTSVIAIAPDTGSVTVIATSLIGSGTDPRTTVGGFDHPVGAIVTSADTAYILECGPECGGSAAGITVLGAAAPGAKIPLPAATSAVLSGSTLYVAGTPPGTSCDSGTEATACGVVSVVDLGSGTVTASAKITDGYHDHLEVGANGQIFIGGRGCTNINDSNEVRGCLSIFNSTDGTVVVPPDTGDVTGIQPITGRNVVYVCQNGELRIYDTTTDQLQTTQIDLIGQAQDVKLVDAPN